MRICLKSTAPDRLCRKLALSMVWQRAMICSVLKVMDPLLGSSDAVPGLRVQFWACVCLNVCNGGAPWRNEGPMMQGRRHRRPLHGKARARACGGNPRALPDLAFGEVQRHSLYAKIDLSKLVSVSTHVKMSAMSEGYPVKTLFRVYRTYLYLACGTRCESSLF